MYRDTNRHLTDITLYEEETGEPFMTATVVIDRFVPIDRAIIKDYSENEGILQALIKAGIVTHVIEHIPCNFVTVQLVQLSEQFVQEYEERMARERGTVLICDYGLR
jgi:hypothetical protein